MGTTLRPMYILFGYMDPYGSTRSHTYLKLLDEGRVLAMARHGIDTCKHLYDNL